MKECDNMRYLNHPNVLTLIGVCLDGGPAPYIVMPFMANGSLLSYLRNERKSVVLDSDAENLVKNTVRVDKEIKVRGGGVI